jgi:hypothetical protein
VLPEKLVHRRTELYSFLQSHAGGQEGRKEASRQSEEDEAAMVMMVADSITPTHDGDGLRDERENSPDGRTPSE